MNHVSSISKQGFKFQYQDCIASLVGFLVAVPLSLGLAIASGAPPGYGLVAAIIGGLIVGFFTGAPLMITGPAAGLVTVTAASIKQFGIADLGLVVLLSGIIQFLAGYFRLGQLFRAITPAVVHGMMAGIGLIIVLGQFQIMFDQRPAAEGLKNFFSIPATILSAAPATEHFYAAMIGLATIAVILLWNLFPKFLKVLPSSLYGIAAAMILANVLTLPINYVDVSANFGENIHWISFGNFQDLLHNANLLTAAISLAFIGSAKALLTASAVDGMHEFERTQNNKEMISQGIGNTLCGLVGVIPISGEILRSTANVQAGARSRIALILIGLWILLLTVCFPQFFKLIPKAGLAGLLVLTGISLINPHHIKTLKKYGKTEVLIYVATALGVVFIDPLEGVLIGMIIGLFNLALRLSPLQVEMAVEESNNIELTLSGQATFMNLPKLVTTLEKLEPGKAVNVNIEELSSLDHATFDFLMSWKKGYLNSGGQVTLEYHHLEKRVMGFATAKTQEAQVS